MVFFYVKTLGKSGVDLHFYALQTHDGTMWWSWAVVLPSSRIVLSYLFVPVLMLHDITT